MSRCVNVSCGYKNLPTRLSRRRQFKFWFFVEYRCVKSLWASEGRCKKNILFFTIKFLWCVKYYCVYPQFSSTNWMRMVFLCWMRTVAPLWSFSKLRENGLPLLKFFKNPWFWKNPGYLENQSPTQRLEEQLGGLKNSQPYIDIRELAYPETERPENLET